MKLGRTTTTQAIELPSYKNIESVTLGFRVLTPQFGGGTKAAEVDQTLPVRTSAIRGQLRWWWRLLRLAEWHSNQLTWGQLLDEENSIWGGPADKQKATTGRSRVGIELLANPTVDASNALPPGSGFGVGLVYFAAKDLNPRPEKPFATYQAQTTGAHFDIRVTLDLVDDKSKQRVLESIRVFCVLGNLGARGRRGAGALELITEVGLGGKPKLSDIAARLMTSGCQVWFARESTSKDPLQCLNAGVERYRNFRQSRPKRQVRDQNGKPITRYGRSDWPEPDSIRHLTAFPRHHPPKFKELSPANLTFPRTPFGLPMVINIRGQGEPGVVTIDLAPTNINGGTRLASPLMIRPVRGHDETYSCLYLVLPPCYQLNASEKLHWTKKGDQPKDLGNSAHLPSFNFSLTHLPNANPNVTIRVSEPVIETFLNANATRQL